MEYVLAVVVGFVLALLGYKVFRREAPAAGVADSLRQVIREELMPNIDDIITAVSELSTINDSLDSLFAQLQTLIEQGRTDPAKFQQALDLIVVNKERTKAAIVANTPAAP